MPIYEYRCRGCGTDFEKYIAGAPAAIACPACAGDDVMRRLSVFGLKTDGGFAAAPMSSSAGGGGCCGGGCGCH